eukprot:g54159.t1
MWAALRDACSLFTADEFIKNRTELANALHEKLIPRLNRSYALVPTLELVNMEFDAQYATAIELTQIARQDVLLALNEYAVAEVEANRSKAEAQTLASITIRNAYATNFSLAQQANAQAALLAFRIQQQTAALATLRRELGLNTSKQVLGYHFFAVLEEVATSKLTLGLPYPNTIQDLIGATAGGGDVQLVTLTTFFRELRRLGLKYKKAGSCLTMPAMDKVRTHMCWKLGGSCICEIFDHDSNKPKCNAGVYQCTRCHASMPKCNQKLRVQW